MEYIVLKVFFGKELLVSGAGCVMYMLCRTLLIFITSLVMGEIVEKLLSAVRNILADKVN